MANQKWQKKFEFKIFKNAEISGILEKMFFWSILFFTFLAQIKMLFFCQKSFVGTSIP